MRTKLRGLLVLCGILFGGLLFAQEKTVTGTVTDSDGFPLADVSVVSSSGEEAFTDIDGNYSITVNEGDELTIESLGLDVVKVTVGASNIYNAQLNSSGVIELEGAVVTALGITREKKSLGYATQEVSGETLSSVPVTNFADALSGEIAGLDINQSGTMGGSTNMVLRGYSSIIGSNQVLIVIDGTPINNNTFNSSTVQRGGGGYDYGNAAMDINPSDIENVQVLKGAAASALYGSRGANGVLMITTKKGKRSSIIGVEVNSSFTVGTVDKETLPKYQSSYGSGYVGESFYSGDINGDGNIDDNIVYTYDDASFGSPFDPNYLVYNWDSQYPQLPGYLIPTPWVAAKSTPNDIWGSSLTFVNSAAFSGGNENGTFRTSFTNYYHEGSLDNSLMKRNTIDFNGDYNFTEKLRVFAGVTYTDSKGLGRVATGYESRNPMQSFRQWWNVSVDMQKQKDAYILTGQNMTWNLKDWESQEVGYADNYYFNRYQNYQTDQRNRYTGNVGLNYKFTDWLSAMGRFTFDNYNELREERIAVGSSGGQGRTDHGGLGEYYFMDHTVSETNYDLIFNVNKDITENINLYGNAGWNLRVNQRNGVSAMTNGGLKIPGLYTIANSMNPLTVNEIGQFDINKKVDGLFAQISLGFWNTLFLEGSARWDRSSALPEDNNRYFYPSGSASLIFSEFFNSKDIVNFGKVRFNYAKVGNDTDPYQVYNIFNLVADFNGSGAATAPPASNNPKLKPEMMEEYEAGLEMAFFRNRVSFDVSLYKRTTFDLITNTTISSSSGYQSLWVNAGDIENKGIEARLTVTPIRTNDFRWDVTANFAKNDNKVLRIFGDNEYLQLASAWNVSIGAKVGEEFGVIRGTNYVYLDGQKVVGSDGKYLVSDDTQEVIGNMNPDWTGGLRNSFSYKNWNLSFLIDFQKGGDIFSYDTAFGFATGLYDRTAGFNELGNPIRDPLSDGGGIILPGVKENGTPNDIRADFSNYTNPYGYYGAPEAEFVYDASFVKLRNLTLSYTLPDNIMKNAFIDKMTLSLIGRNLWIIHKNIPYSDPEAGLSAGNVQGLQIGAHPVFREIGASVKIEF